MNKIGALGLDVKQITKATKKLMAENPVFGVVISESNPEVFTKHVFFKKRAMTKAINDEFVRMGRINKADKVITEKDLLSVGLEKDADIETLLLKIIKNQSAENYPDNLSQAIKKVGSWRKFLSRSGYDNWNKEHFIPMAEEKAKGKIGLLKTIGKKAKERIHD